MCSKDTPKPPAKHVECNVAYHSCTARNTIQVSLLNRIETWIWHAPKAKQGQMGLREGLTDDVAGIGMPRLCKRGGIHTSVGLRRVVPDVLQRTGNYHHQIVHTYCDTCYLIINNKQISSLQPCSSCTTRMSHAHMKVIANNNNTIAPQMQCLSSFKSNGENRTLTWPSTWPLAFCGQVFPQYKPKPQYAIALSFWLYRSTGTPRKRYHPRPKRTCEHVFLGLI